MKKMSVTTTLALLLVLVLGSTVAYAAFNWCPDDPVLTITPPGGDPITFNVIIEVPDGTQGLVSGIVEVKVHVPSNVEDYDVISFGDSFGHGEESVEFILDGEPVEPGDAIWVLVEVKVPGTEEFRVRVTVEAPGVSQSRKGWSNEWVWCKAKL
ncbi:MAG: hypothetical protein H8E47_07065 [Anaerolineales bacterium]|nr:hypothetical protein [Anaerolineales bacterium]